MCDDQSVTLGVGGPVQQQGLGVPGDVRSAGYEELTPLVMQLSEQDKVSTRLGENFTLRIAISLCI